MGLWNFLLRRRNAADLFNGFSSSDSLEDEKPGRSTDGRKWKDRVSMDEAAESLTWVTFDLSQCSFKSSVCEGTLKSSSVWPTQTPTDCISFPLFQKQSKIFLVTVEKIFRRKIVNAMSVKSRAEDVTPQWRFFLICKKISVSVLLCIYRGTCVTLDLHCVTATGPKPTRRRDVQSAKMTLKILTVEDVKLQQVRPVK